MIMFDEKAKEKVINKGKKNYFQSINKKHLGFECSKSTLMINSTVNTCHFYMLITFNKFYGQDMPNLHSLITFKPIIN